MGTPRPDGDTDRAGDDPQNLMEHSWIESHVYEVFVDGGEERSMVNGTSNATYTEWPNLERLRQGHFFPNALSAGSFQTTCT